MFTLKWHFEVMALYNNGTHYFPRNKVSVIGSLLNWKDLKRKQGKGMKNTMALHLTWMTDCTRNPREQKMRLHCYGVRRQWDKKNIGRETDIVLRPVAHSDNNMQWHINLTANVFQTPFKLTLLLSYVVHFTILLGLILEGWSCSSLLPLPLACFLMGLYSSVSPCTPCSLLSEASPDLQSFQL